MKSRYFSQTDLFQVETKARDSWLWRSWNGAKHLIQEGCRWLVGSGKKINIWNDQWLASASNKKVSPPKPPDCSLQTVDELMLPNGMGWNLELLNRIFDRPEAQLIRNTPISSLGLSDRLVWCETQNGQYSVRSGYTVAKRIEKRTRGDEGTSGRKEEEDSNCWRGIWKLNIKKKVQHFIWRSCHDRMPVASNLRKRGIELDTLCKGCGEEHETMEHIMFHCPVAQHIWKMAPVQWSDLETFTGSFKDWWTRVGNAPSRVELSERLELSAYIMWQIWKCRNQWVYNGEKVPEREVVQRAWAEWNEYLNEQTKVHTETTKTAARVDRPVWERPTRGVTKLNVCSHCEGKTPGAGLGIVARDDAGGLLQSWAIVKEGIDHPVMAELEAVRAGLILAQQNEWRTIELQVEIQAIALCLQAGRSPVLEAAVIAEDISILAMMFESCSFTYGHKSVNRFCSHLANMAYRSHLMQSWKGNFPLWMLQEATEDLRSFDQV